MCREYISNSSATLRSASLRITGRNGNPVIGQTINHPAPRINPLCHGSREVDGEDDYSSSEEFQPEPETEVVVSPPIMLFQQHCDPVRPDPVRPVNIGEYQMGIPAWTVVTAGLKLTSTIREIYS